MDEDGQSKARADFIRLAEARVKKAIKDIRLIGNLANKSNYKYTERDIKEIFTTLDRELKSCRDNFTKRKRKDDIDFSLQV